MNDQDAEKVKFIVYCLGYGGLIPFILTLAGIYFGNHAISAYSVVAFISYASVILGFVGAVHWGFILKSDLAQRQGLLLSISVLPGLIAWLALISPLPIALITLTIAYPLVLIYERLSELNELLPDWYRSMRVILTISVTTMLLISFVPVVLLA